YLAVRGGIGATAFLGSRSRDTLAALGPAPLRGGERLEVGSEVAADMLVDAVPPASYDDRPVLRVVRGPRDDWACDPDALVSRTWSVGAASDRVGLRLEGEPLAVVPGRGELPSEGSLRG